MKEEKHTYNNKGNRDDKPKLTANILFRLLPIDKNIIRAQAKRYGLSTGEYIRCRALEIAPPAEYHPEEYIYLELLKKVSCDLKRLSNIIRAKDEHILSDISEIVAELKTEIKRIKSIHND